jgi:hypothetical protein
MRPRRLIAIRTLAQPRSKVLEIIGVAAPVVSIMDARKDLSERGHENLRIMNETGVTYTLSYVDKWTSTQRLLRLQKPLLHITGVAT